MTHIAVRTCLVACVLGAILPSCATYFPLPLPEEPDLRTSARGLEVSAEVFPLREGRLHLFDPRRPLDADDVAIIAVANNPDLRATRTRIGVAAAEVFAAGILPNPQFSFDYGFLIGGPGTTDARDLVALNSAETQLLEIDQAILKNRHDLNALLGLTPEATLRLSERISLPALDSARLEPLLRDLAARRPDLLALQAGYQAQDDKLRQAIIEQFPKLSVGSNFARDTSDVRTQSVAVTISLPIFDRNQGNIAIAEATREQLWQEYQARLDVAYGEAKRLVSELRFTEEQYRSSLEAGRRLREAVATAQPAYQAGNLDERTFVDLQTSLLARQIATARLEQTILEQRVGLQTLIGSRLPNRPADLPRMP